MKYEIDNIRQDEYAEVIQVWEAHVKTIDHFLREDDIEHF